MAEQKTAYLKRFVNKFIWNSEKRGSVVEFGNNAWSKLWQFLDGGVEEDSGQNVSSETGTRINTVFNCLNLLGQDIATFPKQIRVDKESGKEVLKTPLHKLLNLTPNKWENAWQFWYGTIFMGEGWGNSYAYITERDQRGYATEMIRLKPWMVVPQIVESELFYVIDNKVSIPARDIFHYRSMVTDGPIGENKIVYNAKTMGLKLKQQKYTSTSVGNKPPAILFMKGGTDEQAKQNKEMWKSMVSGDNIGGTPVLIGEDFDYKNIMLDPQAADIILQHQLSDQYLMGIWRIQPAKLSMHERSSYNVVEQQNIFHVRDALMPIITNLEQEISAKLFPASNMDAENPEYVKFNVKSLLRGDTATQTAFYQFLTVNGIANADEIRSWEDLGPQLDEDGKPGIGKKYYIQGAMKVKDGTEDGTQPVGSVEGDERTLELLEKFAKRDKLNGYAKKEEEIA